MQPKTGFLAGKKLLITGVLSNRSHRLWHCQGPAMRRVQSWPSATKANASKSVSPNSPPILARSLVFDCDVSSDEQIAAMVKGLTDVWPKFDGFVHAIGFAPREAIAGDFLEGLSREAFAIAHDISAYSFPAMAKAFLPHLNDNAALLTLSYLGALRTVPNYNTMGLAKASLEASVRYLAESLGSHNRGLRANGISAGPIKTLAASGIKGFGKILEVVAANAPIRRNVTIDDVGNVAAFLLSDLAAGVSAEITYVDGGFSQVVGGIAD
jgi:enoyl-[acyl-carrier protein] reductase I